MDNQWWSWILTAVGLTGFYFAGKKVWWSWYINLGCQALWLAYALVTQQYGFIMAAVAYSVLFFKNAYQWTRARFKKDPRHKRTITNLKLTEVEENENGISIRGVVVDEDSLSEYFEARNRARIQIGLLSKDPNPIKLAGD